jgi:tRNA (cytidine/uridine-2'-O-)-methyltransferase
MQVVLVEPEIPPNTGNVARLCAATRSILHLVEPFGFDLSDRTLRRAGMDYWQHVEWHRWKNWEQFVSHQPNDAQFWLVESEGARLYSEAEYGAGDYLVFGRETAGLPARLLERHRDRCVRIPMFSLQARSLNLSNCVALVLFEALRQSGFQGCEH